MNSENLYYNKDFKELARKLRKDSTKAEVILWKEMLRGGNMHDYTFLRQRPIMNYIVDFMCKKLMLIIKIDGFTHNWEEQWKLDKKRQIKLENGGFNILRFTDEEILNDLKNVGRTIEHWVINHPPAPPSKGDKKGLGLKERNQV